jgi:hypothetical protein
MADWDGFLPGATCRRCGVRLQGQGEGRPAESYAGTYNGLCYPCTGRPADVIGHYSDGAVLVEHPPSCPSWRRNRETFYAFPGCEACKGLGAKWNYGNGGGYLSQCKVCQQRRYGAWNAYTSRRQSLIDGMAAIEKECRSKALKSKFKSLGDDWTEMWATDSLAVEYRAFMKELWETPIVQEPNPTLIQMETVHA